MIVKTEWNGIEWKEEKDASVLGRGEKARQEDNMDTIICSVLSIIGSVSDLLTSLIAFLVFHSLYIISFLSSVTITS